MDVLVTESVPGTARDAAEQLVAAGHRVLRCHEATEPAFPCTGLATGSCPLESGPIDLVLTVRRHVRSVPTATEDGVVCALRRRVPVAVAGQTFMNPFEDYGAETVDGEIVAECERIAGSRREAHERIAHDVLRHALGEDTIASAVVRRAESRLAVTLTLPEDVAHAQCQQLAVRVAGRLREYDPYAAGVDVDVVNLSSPT